MIGSGGEQFVFELFKGFLGVGRKLILLYFKLDVVRHNRALAGNLPGFGVEKFFDPFDQFARCEAAGRNPRPAGQTVKGVSDFCEGASE